MKPYFSDKVFLTATKEEVQMLRTAVRNLQERHYERKEYDEYEKALYLGNDLDIILKVLPF